MRIGVALEFDDQSDRFTVAGAGLVAHRGYALDPLVLHQFADFLAQPDSGLLIRNFTDNDLTAIAFLDNFGAGAEDDFAAAGKVTFEDALPAADDAAGWVIRPGNDLHQLFDGHFRVID